MSSFTLATTANSKVKRSCILRAFEAVLTSLEKCLLVRWLLPLPAAPIASETNRFVTYHHNFARSVEPLHSTVAATNSDLHRHRAAAAPCSSPI